MTNTYLITAEEILINTKRFQVAGYNLIKA